MPTSWGSRFPLRVLQVEHAVSTLVQVLEPPRDRVVPRQAFAVPQLVLVPATKLAAVAIAGEQERIGDLTAEAARDVDELDETDHRGPRQRQAFAAHDRAVGLDDFGLAVDHEAQRPAHGHHRQRLERRVER